MFRHSQDNYSKEALEMMYSGPHNLNMPAEMLDDFRGQFYNLDQNSDKTYVTTQLCSLSRVLGVDKAIISDPRSPIRVETPDMKDCSGFVSHLHYSYVPKQDALQMRCRLVS